jgi:hypothetical protein
MKIFPFNLTWYLIMLNWCNPWDVILPMIQMQTSLTIFCLNFVMTNRTDKGDSTIAA